MFEFCELLALLKYHDVNACAIDWTNWAHYDYFFAATVLKRKIGKFVAKLLLRFRDYGTDLERVILVGHSAGAHIFGHTGFLLKGKIGTMFGNFNSVNDWYLVRK